ncbi:MAG: hypothetical protein AB1746_00160 [Candidatus Zixiibacteriota bacterium]
MPDTNKHSEGPWQWTDFGVLSDASGTAILDYEDWNLSPEDAVLISAAPDLLAWIRKIVEDYQSELSEDDLHMGKSLITKATDPAIVR